MPDMDDMTEDWSIEVDTPFGSIKFESDDDDDEDD